MSIHKAPCKDCRDRTVNCHSRNKDGTWVCEEWGNYEAYKEQMRKTKYESIAKNGPVGDYYKARAIKRMRREARDK